MMTSNSSSTNRVVAPLYLLAKFPVVLYYCAVAVTDLPELAFLLSLIFCEEAYQQVVAKASSLWSKLFGCINLGALLMAFLVSGTPRFELAFPTIIAFLTICATNKARKFKTHKASSFEFKIAPDTASCSSPPQCSPLRIQGPKLIEAPKLVEAPKVVEAPKLVEVPKLVDVAKCQASPEKRPVVRDEQATTTQATCARQQQKSLVPPWRQEMRLSAGGASKVPVTSAGAPKDLAVEVQDLMRNCRPNPSDEKVVRMLVNVVRRSVITIVPEADVFGCAIGNLSYNAAQGLKPEVEIVVNASPQVLKERLTAFFLKGPVNEYKKPKSLATLHPDLLQKTATRVLSERLNNMRYWRSQFTGPEPKTVLLAPVSLGICDYSIRVSFSVNNPYPENLVTVFSKGDRPTQELILLVTKWAKVRGISHTAKGHLHAYAFGLLVVYFMRRRRTSQGDLSSTALVTIFQEFVQFYGALFDRREDGVSVCFTTAGKDFAKAQPRPESALWGIPYIEDPFNASNNVASALTAESLGRLRQELERASQILAGGITTLAELLEQWEFPRPQADSACTSQVS